MKTILDRLTSRPARLGGSRLRRSRLSLFGGIAAVGLALISPAQSASAAELLNETLRDGTLPAGWSPTAIDFRTAAGGYALFEELGSILTSPSIDASAFDVLQVNLSVAKFGSGVDGPLTLEYSLNAGIDWSVAQTSSTPTSSTYIDDVLTVPSTSADMQIRFVRPDSPSQKRLRDVVVTGLVTSGPPEVGDVVASPVLSTEATVTASFAANTGDNFTEYGFLIAETSVNANPEIGGVGVAVIDFDPLVDPLTFSFSSVLTDLSPGTDYSVRGYAIFDSGASTVLSASVTNFTTTVPPGLDGVTDYSEDFSGFDSAATLPPGWSVSGAETDYLGLWGSGFSAGLRGGASVLGYQHTAGTGTFVKSVSLINNTGATLDEITVSYLGRVERSTENRSPAYTVTVNGLPAPGLSYSTKDGDLQFRGAAFSALGIPAGESFVIEWSSDRDESTTDSSKQIGISDVTVSVGITPFPPVISGVSIDSFLLESESFSAAAEVLSDNGTEVTLRGFVYSEAALNPEPSIGGSAVIQVDAATSGVGAFDSSITGLTSGTTYAIRAFATNAVDTVYSPVTTVITPLPDPLLGGAPYTESFSSFAGGLLPAGWSISSSADLTDYSGVWDVSEEPGVVADEVAPGVLGYQHSADSGEVTFSLTLVNDTGSFIENLEIGYTGRAGRLDQTRFPEWTVVVDFQEISALAYSTESGASESKSAIVTGLFIPDGASFTISWSSNQDGPGTGTSRHIGISGVEVTAIDGLFLSPVEVDIASGTYLEPFLVTLTNFDFDAEIRYTLDGTDPVESSTLYVDPILIDTSVTLRAAAFPADPLSPFEPGPVAARSYTLPVVLTDLASLRAQPTGSAVYRVDSTMILTAQTGFRNTKFFQDASGAGIQIDDPGGVITAVYEPGDAIESLVGTLSTFQGQLQFTPAADPGAPASSGNVVTPVVRTLDGLGFADQSILVTVESVEFENAGGNFGGGGSQTGITDPSVVGFTGILRNVTGESDLAGSLIPAGIGSLTGVIQQRNAGPTISPRNVADLDFAPILGDAFDDFVAVAPEGEREISDAPAGDGVANLFKYAFGGSPIVSDRSKLPVQSIVEDSGESYLGISFTPDRNFTWDAQSGTFTDGVVTLTVESSTDLSQGSWSPATGMVLVGGGTELTSGQAVTLRLSTAIDSQTAPRSFLRISGERVPAPL